MPKIFTIRNLLTPALEGYFSLQRDTRPALSVLLKEVSKSPWIEQIDWNRIVKGQTFSFSLCQSLFFNASSVKRVSNSLHSILLPITCAPASCSWLWMRWQKSGLHSRVRGAFSWMGTGSVVSSRCCHSSSLSGSWGTGEWKRSGAMCKVEGSSSQHGGSRSNCKKQWLLWRRCYFFQTPVKRSYSEGSWKVSWRTLTCVHKEIPKKMSIAAWFVI